MVAINPEMLRELLEEFTEKEEVTREEMNAINQQIAELEKRIESSKVKLAGLNRDREKIDLMRERYLSGNWKLQLSNMSPSAASSQPSSTAEPASTQPAPASPSSPSSHAEGRAARRAAREAASQPAASDSTAASVDTSGSTATPVDAPVAESVPAPEPEPEAPPAVEPVVETAPVVEVTAPVAAVIPEPEPEPEPFMPSAPASAAPTFSSVAQFEAAQAESSIEHAPPDDPIMSSFSSAPSNAPDINAALASSSQIQEAPVVEPENSGFSWSSTAITALPASGPDNSAGQVSAGESAPMPSSPMPSSPMPNPWGSSESDSAPTQPVVEQRQSAADIWGHPAATSQAAPSAQQAEGAWGDFGEDWQMKEAEAQRAAANNAPAPPPPPPAPASEGGWGQTGGGSPWSSPATTQPAPADLPPAGGGWGQPTASRQGMPAMQAPTSFPVAPAPDAASSSNSAADAWGRSGQASSSGWATQGSPWGDPAGQAQPPAPAPANPFSQPQASQQPAQLPGTPMPAPEQGAGGDESRSSLARAADGALISPVKGRRRGAGTPAAFDWGSPDSSSSGNSGDPNQSGASEDSGDNKKIDDVLKGLFK